MNRFDLEDAMCQLYNMGDDIDIVLHSYMDSKIRPTEDQMANMLIGIKELHNARYQKMWQIFEDLIKNKTITDKGCDCETCTDDTSSDDNDNQLLNE